MTRSHSFTRAWRRLHVLASNSDWVIAPFAFVVIAQSNYLSLGFYDTHLKTVLSSREILLVNRKSSFD